MRVHAGQNGHIALSRWICRLGSSPNSYGMYRYAMNVIEWGWCQRRLGRQSSDVNNMGHGSKTIHSFMEMASSDEETINFDVQKGSGRK